MKNLVKKTVSKIIAIVLPNRCLACNCFISDDEVFCQDDLRKLHFIKNPKCKICSFQFEEIGVEICQKCLQQKPAFDSAVAVFAYSALLSQIIHGLKYYDQTLHAKKLGKLMNQAICENDDIKNYQIIAPIPISKNRLKTRKFNQSALLALQINKQNRHLKFMPELLLRTKFSKAQAHLSQQERIENIKNSFAINEKYRDFVKGKKILLIDDVMTTGSTLNACAKALKDCEAGEIKVVIVAKTNFLG